MSLLISLILEIIVALASDNSMSVFGLRFPISTAGLLDISLLTGVEIIVEVRTITSPDMQISPPIALL